MRNLSIPVLLPAPPRQLSTAEMSPSERRAALARLAILLIKAAGVAAGERDDDERRSPAGYGAQTQSRGLYPAVHPGLGSNQSREPAPEVRAPR
jgi:hypothetical protein